MHCHEPRNADIHGSQMRLVCLYINYKAPPLNLQSLSTTFNTIGWMFFFLIFKFVIVFFLLFLFNLNQMVDLASAKVDATPRYLHGNWQAPLTVEHWASCHGLYCCFSLNQIQCSKLESNFVQILAAHIAQGKYNKSDWWCSLCLVS